MKKQLLTLSVRIGGTAYSIVNKELQEFLPRFQTLQKSLTPEQLRIFMKAGKHVLATLGNSHKSVKDQDEAHFKGTVDGVNVFIQLSYVRVQR
jgi:hypothetical protein